MKHLICCASIAAFALSFAGCSSSSTSTSPTPVPQKIFVGNVGNNSISVFPAGSNGNVAPTSTISGAATLINEPYYLAVDRSGNIWSSNWSGGGAGSITMYAPGATGNTAPTVDLTGAATLLTGPCGLVVDSAGKIYNAQCNSASVLVFAAGSNGNVAPSQDITGAATTLGFPEGLALDSSGNIWVGDCGGPGTQGVKEWPNGATGNVAPTVFITNAAMTCVDGVAIDGSGKIYAANDVSGANAIFVFAAGSNGASTPVQTITGSNTLLSTPYSVVLDNQGNIWVGNSNGVLMFPGNANGNVAPTVNITGAATLVNEPYGVALH
ncbi:MAG: hypothetical protein JO219_12700 [Candidatus Eremiobacteraeota bacterium]|nr:hypothetical protein [Candidatus Eremiobacteraeota bacterium]MBV8367217.1 hypothetical protein [Candidatus Eremiobacteraeota bacterium]